MSTRIKLVYVAMICAVIALIGLILAMCGGNLSIRGFLSLLIPIPLIFLCAIIALRFYKGANDEY